MKGTLSAESRCSGTSAQLQSVRLEKAVMGQGRAKWRRSRSRERTDGVAAGRERTEQRGDARKSQAALEGG